jgi:hypothetical protein
MGRVVMTSLGVLLVVGQLSSVKAQGVNALTVSATRATICPLGPTRPDTNYLPGDIVHVTFNVSGLKLDNDGRYRVAARLVVEDAAGKAVATEDYGTTPARLGALAGGKTRFAFRYLVLPNAPAGAYKAKLQLTDALANQTATIEQSFKVIAPTFGLIRFTAGRGPFGQAETPCTGAVGEVLFMGALAVGLSKGKEGQGNVEVRLEVQDAQGKPLGKPQVTELNTVNTNEPLLLKFELPLDQGGKYQVVWRVIDKAATPPRSATLTVPVTVVE